MNYLNWIAEHWAIFLVTLYLVLYFGTNGVLRLVAILKGQSLTEIEKEDHETNQQPK